MPDFAGDSNPVVDVFCDAFKASPIGIVLEDLEGRPQFVNAAFCSMVGLSEAEVLGKHCADFSPVEDAEKDWALFCQLRAGLIDRYHLDKRYYRQDGSMFWGRVSLSLLNHRPSPLVIAIVEDITDRLASRETLELATRDVMVARCSADLRYVWVSPEYAKGLRRPADAIVGSSIAEVLGRDAFDALRSNFERVLAGETVQYEDRVSVSGIGPRWISATYTPARDAAGQIVGWVSVVVDITERKLAQDSLVWRLDFERLLSDLSRTFISLPDAEVDANVERAMARIGGFLELDRISLFELSRTATEFTLKYLWTSDGTRQPSPVVSIRDQPWWTRQVLHGDVSRVSTIDDLPEEATAERDYLRQRGVLSAASIPLNVGGDITGAISFISVRRHVTWTDDLIAQLRVVGDVFSNALKRKRAMEELRAAEAITRESEARFRLVANTAPAMIWMSGTDAAQCTYVNQSWLSFTGRTLESELGTGWTDGVHPDDAARCRRIIGEAFERREPFQAEYRILRRDGRYRWVLDYGVPRFNLDGSFAGYIGSCVDVTDRKEADAIRSSFSRSLIRAQEDERAAVGRELHDDINQRVALAALNLEILKSDASVEPEARGEIEKVVQQLGEICEDIQALSHRLHTSKLEQLGLKAAAAGFCREVSAKHKMEIEFESGEIPRDVRNEISICLFRVLQEAVQNSTKHSGSPRLRVSLSASPSELQLTVSDSGKGFNLQDAMRGRGIGLVNMTERLRLVRGDLSITSERGRGTVVRAVVPLGSRAMPSGL